MSQDILLICYRIENFDQLKIALEQAQIIVEQTDETKTAMPSLEQHSPVFLLLDSDIENAEGFLQEISESILLNPPPYILMADTFLDSLDRAIALDMGADACVAKPISPQEVVSLIRAVLQREHKLARLRASRMIEVQDLAKKENIRFRDALKLSRLPPEQQEDAARQLATETLHSVDEYHPAQVEPEPASTPPSMPDAPSTVSVSGGGYYATIRDSVADLKNPDKGRSRTPEMFLVSFTFFLQRFCQGIGDYTSSENAALFPALTQQQLDQIRQEVNSTCSALRNLLHKMERTAQK